jgi:hypothetical protein
MTASNPTLHIDLNIKLDDATDKMIEEIKASLGIPKSQIVREAIRNHHRFRFGRQPTCAHGESCRMPQAFSWPTAPTAIQHAAASKDQSEA